MEDLPAPLLQPQEVATYLQYASQPHHEPVYELGVSDFLTMIPGISYANTPQWGGSMSSSYGEVSGASNFFVNAPQQTCAGQANPTPSIPTPQPQQSLPQPSYVATSTPTQLVPPPSQLTHDLPIRNGSHTALPPSDFHSQLGGGIFRPSCYQMEPGFGRISSHAQYQTAIFRNSHFNVAHFLNPDFQPEQWDPDDEYAAATSSGKSSSRHKCSG
jgi:ubiquitin thioesterase protein OTUB1